MQTVKNFVLSTVTSNFPTDVNDTIVVTGSPRSGTTWLSELLRELSGYKMLNEPLNLNSSVLAKDVDDLDWRTYVSPGEARPELEVMLEKALTGRVGVPYMWRFQSDTTVGRFLEILVNRKLVVKLIRAGRMLSWVSERFPVRAVVSILRHPCAAVASQMNYQANWRTARPPSLDELQTGFGGQLPDWVIERFGDTLAEVDSTAGHLAAVWCLDTYLTVNGNVASPWIVTTYEDLVRDPEHEMQRILDGLGATMPKAMRRTFREPSHSAAEDLAEQDPKAQLSKWRSRLDRSQVDAVMEVVSGFGLDSVYSEDLEPDRTVLRQYVNDHARSRSSSNTSAQARSELQC